MQAISPPPASYNSRTPGVPRRSSRRTPSGDQSHVRSNAGGVAGGFEFDGFDGPAAGPTGGGGYLDERDEAGDGRRWDHGGRF